MEFSEWEPVYERILADFGYPRRDDERARDVIDELLGGVCYAIDDWSLAGQRVAIAGGAEQLTSEQDLVLARQADTVIAASTAADDLRAADISVDCMVTDMDKNPETARELTAHGIPVAVHAHGDNIDLLREYVPAYEHSAVIPTTQAEPKGIVRNFGGFTDGDRAAFLAQYCGAAELVFPGWDFADPSVSPEKRKKLDWAAQLLYELERRRNEQFSILNDRRADLSSLMVSK